MEENYRRKIWAIVVHCYFVVGQYLANCCFGLVVQYRVYIVQGTAASVHFNTNFTLHFTD